MFCSIWFPESKAWSEEINIDKWRCKIIEKRIKPNYKKSAEAPQACNAKISSNEIEKLTAWIAAIAKSKI